VPQYEHTQEGPVHLIGYGLAAIFIGIAWFSSSRGMPYVGMLALAGLMIFLALCFQRLTVRDEGEWLAIRYGPLPLFWRRIPYASMTAAEAARSDWLDGGGIHYIPGRGWIYNLWGRDCVKLQLGNKKVRIGTNDVEGLLRFIKTRVG
jgi:hypothetical protein